MSSDFYPPSLSRNLIRTGAFGYRENVALGILDRAEAAGRQGDRFEAAESFVAFPNFSHGPETGRRTSTLRIHSLGHSPEQSQAQPQGQSRLSTLAASLDEHSGIGRQPL
ncbi:hypothetical protein [Rhizobium sp. WYJ-E13]|uniref:hypothetical protein n=1 Tax=Rhizobium sp. WYJ-E13 TaxID=2849093 RepID=UPI001C1EAC2E|nr:hypothetical protein [Rhizobium sp. WYJ-E13]QWW66178.1 hypothetical protein KQ933_11040 [Rhizobium sp. WYJ-E13]